MTWILLKMLGSKNLNISLTMVVSGKFMVRASSPGIESVGAWDMKPPWKTPRLSERIRVPKISVQTSRKFPEILGLFREWGFYLYIGT